MKEENKTTAISYLSFQDEENPNIDNLKSKWEKGLFHILQSDGVDVGEIIWVKTIGRYSLEVFYKPTLLFEFYFDNRYGVDNNNNKEQSFSVMIDLARLNKVLFHEQ